MVKNSELVNILNKEFYFSHIMTSGNGYPIFDIMVPLNPGYMTSSRIVFYTEDDSKLAEFLDLKNKATPKELDTWILFNLTHIHHTNEIYNTYGELTSNRALAYGHMKDDESIKEMYARNNFGVASFIEKDDIKGHKVYVFHQSNGTINGEFQQKREYKDEVYEVQDYVRKQYNKGKITPEFVFEGRIAQKIVDAYEKAYGLKGDYLKESEEHQLLLIVKGYLNELNIQGASVNASTKGGLFVNVRLSSRGQNIVLSVNDDKYNVVVGLDKKESLEIGDALAEIGKEYLKMKTLSYTKKMKV